MYYELLEDGTIGRSTPNEKIAKSLGLNLETDKEIVTSYNGKRYLQGEEPTQPEKTYVEKRLEEYPSFGDQLDMIYHDRMDGTSIWQETISAIKEKYPKK